MRSHLFAKLKYQSSTVIFIDWC